MKSLLLMVALAASLLVIGGCAGTFPGAGGVTPGFLFTGNTIPAGMTDDQVYQAYPDSFTVVGMVEGSSGNTNILGIFSVGNGGLRAAIDDAKAQVGADGLINCVADIKSTSVLMFFGSSKTIVRGLAIKRK